MNIVVDAQIPLAEELFSRFGRVTRLPGTDISPSAVAEADILLVRSVTRVDATLLDASAVRFVGSATIGTDHVDADYLTERGIAFAYAPGSNADSVAEYVIAALLSTFADRGDELRDSTIGVVGLGQIGGRVERRAAALGMHVMCCDPPRERAAVDDRDYQPLSDLLSEADVITLHVPLTRSRLDPTHHLIDETALSRMKVGSRLINTSRGAVVDNRALLVALDAGRLGGAILDVWEGEPRPDPRLIEACTVATPHIAGYSYDGKAAGALMLAEALAEWLGEPADPALRTLLAPDDIDPLTLPEPSLSETDWLDALVCQMYDVRSDHQAMRAIIDVPERERAAGFQNLRAEYPVRRSFEWYHTGGPVPEHLERAVRMGLGVSDR